MCGIAGIFSSSGIEPRDLRRLIDPLVHRGPDDQGVWIDEAGSVGLGHRRLAILDLTASGHQPMVSADGRFVVSFNGEIYNHSELREELERAGAGPPGGWRGHSDTETLLECVSAWGLAKAVSKTAGMFALAMWDKKDRTISLVRDRFGEKPLYYGWVGNDFVFGSELKAIRAHPRFSGEIDRRALQLFVARTYIPAPLSIYRRIFKLEPASILIVTPEAAKAPRDEPPREGVPATGLTLRRYWSYRDIVRSGFERPIEHEMEALERLEQVLAKTIRQQSIADVPVGAFLSGGIDSSTVVALYQKYSSVPVRTFSIGFEDVGFNEAKHAKAVAAHLGTVHNEQYVTVSETRDVIPLLPSIYDEPFADSSQIPTYLVSRFAREQVTVALTGDGGDELFAGYNRHFAAPKLWRQLRRLPRPLRSAVGSPLSRVRPRFWGTAARLLPGLRQPQLGYKIQKGLRLAGSVRNFDELYCSFLDEWSFEQTPVRDAEVAATVWDMNIGPGAPDTLRMMFCDAVSYLPDDILCKVDRASMAVSLETRVPYLDHRVAEVAARIPLDMKVCGGVGKHIIRELLYREVPRKLFQRRKAGFAIPVGEWIKGPLRPWAEELLDPSRMASEGWFDLEIIQRRWRDHLADRRDSTPALWAVLMFQSWLREQNQRLSAAA